MTSNTLAQEARAISPVYHLTALEKILLLVPTLGGLVFGLGPLLIPGPFASISGATGDDPYIYRLVGAAAFGYPVAVLLGLRQNWWLPVRLLVIAILVFNLGSLYAIAAQVATGAATPVVYLILVASILIIAITVWMLNNHRGLGETARDTAPWLKWFLIFATVAGAGVGLLLLFVPVETAHFWGYKGTDVFLYRQGGAASLGYAAMGIFELRSLNWEELRLPIIMALVFNGLSFILSLFAILMGEPSLLPFVIAAVSLIVTVGTLVALGRRGR